MSSSSGCPSPSSSSPLSWSWLLSCSSLSCCPHLCCPIFIRFVVVLLSSYPCCSLAGPVVPVPLLPISTCEQLLAAAVGDAVVMAIVMVFSCSLLFHASYPASRGWQWHCHPHHFIALSSSSLAPSIPPYEQMLVAVVVMGCLVGCRSCCAVLPLLQQHFLFQGV